MKNQWMAYVIVAVISALAGVAIAGPPNNVGTEPTIIVPATTVPTTIVATESTEAPAVEEPVETTPVATDPEATTTTVPATATTVPATTTTTTEPQVDRASIIVVSVNGAGTEGLATRVRNELVDAGFTQARATDGTTLVDDTIVYFLPGFAREAIEVAAELGLEFTDVKPIEEAPQFGQLDGDQVAVYIGRDLS
jgi:hypothetical protein